jgi:hypothetical protein
MMKKLGIVLAALLWASLACAQQLPSGLTNQEFAVTATGAGTTAATTATLPAAGGKFTYICGFSITSTATAGLASTATVATVAGGNTLTFGQSVGTSPAVASTLENFSPCIPASAVSTGITVTSAAAGTAGVTNVSVWGYQFSPQN